VTSHPELQVRPDLGRLVGVAPVNSRTSRIRWDWSAYPCLAARFAPPSRRPSRSGKAALNLVMRASLLGSAQAHGETTG